MKRHLPLLLALIAGLAVIGMMCEDSPIQQNGSQPLSNQDYPPIENLDFEVINDPEGHVGGGLRVFWNPPSGATPDEYVVSVDDVDHPAVQTTEDYVYTPAGKISVYAVYGENQSEPVELGLKAVETEYLDAWSAKDPSPEHPSGIGFDLAGYATAYAMSWRENWPYIDYYVDTMMCLASPNMRTPEPMNYENNTSCAESDSYEELEIVKPCELEGYMTQQPITEYASYGLWLDPDDDGYTSDDHFGKAYIVRIDNLKVTFKLGYQKVPGLRWVVTERGFTGIKED